MRIAKGILLCGVLLLATSELAHAGSDPPWGWPQCKGNPHEAVSDLNKKKTGGLLFYPYAPYRDQYLGIYRAIETWAAPGGQYFYPIVKFEEHQNWVRVYRVSGRKDGKPIEPVKIDGKLAYSGGERALSMRIDKCDGKISEMKFIGKMWNQR